MNELSLQLVVGFRVVSPVVCDIDVDAPMQRGHPMFRLLVTDWDIRSLSAVGRIVILPLTELACCTIPRNSHIMDLLRSLPMSMAEIERHDVQQEKEDERLFFGRRCRGH